MDGHEAKMKSFLEGILQTEENIAQFRSTVAAMLSGKTPAFALCGSPDSGKTSLVNLIEEVIPLEKYQSNDDSNHTEIYRYPKQRDDFVILSEARHPSCVWLPGFEHVDRNLTRKIFFGYSEDPAVKKIIRDCFVKWVFAEKTT